MEKIFGPRGMKEKYRQRPEDNEEFYEEDEFYGDEEEDGYRRDDDDDYDRDYEDGDYPEDDYPEDERDYSDDDYPEDDDYPDDDYPEDDYEDEGYPEDDYSEDDDYPEDEDYPEDDDDYPDDYPDDDDYPEDDYEEDYRRGGRRSREDESFGSRIVAFLAGTTLLERIAAAFAILLVVGGIITANFYTSSMGNRAALDSFTEVGASLNANSDMVIGQSGLIAVADAESARAMAAGLITEDEDGEAVKEEDVADDAQDVVIKMTLTSIKSDIKVKFINSKTGKLVGGLPLEIEVVTPDGTTVTYNDHDQDGIIYKKDITAGIYKITPKKLPAGYEKYNLEISTQSLTVKDQVEMKAVDVSNEVKKESQVNVAKEDTAVKTEVESKLEDTVEWVESTKTAVGESSDGNYSYEEVNKDTIADPSSSAMIGFRPFMMLGALGSTSENASITDASTPTTDTPAENATSDSGSTESSTEKKDEGSNSSSEGNTSGNNASDNGSTGNSGNTDNSSHSNSGSDNTNTSGDSNKETEKKETITITSSGSVELQEGQTSQINASGASTSIKYSSDNTAVATVSDSGLITAVKEGTATITLSSDKAENKPTVTVKVTKKPEEKKTMTIAVDPSTTIKAGDKATLKVTGPSSFTVRSADESVVKVEGTTLTGVKESSTAVKVTITADGYNDATVDITVVKADAKVMTVAVSPSTTIKVGDTATLSVSGPTKKSFKTSDEKIITVDTEGKVTAIAAGKAKITVSASEENYASVDVEITVTAKETDKVPMSISKLTLVEGQTFKVSSSDSKVAIKLATSNAEVASVSDNIITAKLIGDATITVSASGYQDNAIAVHVESKNATLKDKEGRVVYVLNSDGTYREATYNDYYSGVKFYVRKAATEYRYTGWQTIGGKTYFFDKNGNYVTGEQVIQGAKYTFGSDGTLASSSGVMGIDVSKWNGNIDWNAVKNSGINFVIIRCGYRGSSQGALIEDSKFRSNINGALNAGLKVGVYFFTQAVNEVEAVEEASMVINMIQGYNISYPVYLDVEASNGRGDQISASQRTANIKAFCGTIQNAGYKAGVYANKTWFTSQINTSQISNYKIWLAQYASAVSYNASRLDMWQYTSKGKVTGISGSVDMNICY